MRRQPKKRTTDFMPAYPMPPWLQGASPEALAQLALSSARATSEVQMEKARLSQQQQQAQAEMAQRAEIATQAHDREMQQLETAKAYQGIQTQLRQKELDQAQQALTITATAAARRFQAQQQYQQAIASGVDPAQAILQFGPAMGQQASPEAAALRMSRQVQPLPASTTKFAGEDFIQVPGPNGTTRYQQVRHAPVKKAGLSDFQKMSMLQRLEKERAALDSDNTLYSEADKPDPKWSKGRVAAFNAYKRRASQIDAAIERLNTDTTDEADANMETDQEQPAAVNIKSIKLIE